jgi:hypothetical protein
MKSVQKVTRVQLKTSPGHKDFLLGIVSTEPDYKLSLAINKEFRISLKNTSPLKTTDDKGCEMLFSRFTDISCSPDLIYNLISNRADKNYLLKKLKNVDFIFQVQDSENQTDLNQLTSSLRKIESINAVFIIDLNIIKEKNLQYLI